MKYITILFFFSVILINAQEKASVEKSIFKAQIGLFGVWVNNESKLSDKIALRSEIGLNMAGAFSNSSGDLSFAFTPVITLEPRFYYNLNRRVEKDRDILNNSANYVTLHIDYTPDWFYISNEDLDISPTISFIPKYGIQRNIGRHFNYEFGVGFGLIYRFEKTFTRTVDGYSYQEYNWDGTTYQPGNIYDVPPYDYSYTRSSETSLTLDLTLRIGYTF